MNYGESLEMSTRGLWFHKEKILESALAKIEADRKLSHLMFPDDLPFRLVAWRFYRSYQQYDDVLLENATREDLLSATRELFEKLKQLQRQNKDQAKELEQLRARDKFFDPLSLLS